MNGAVGEGGKGEAEKGEAVVGVSGGCPGGEGRGAVGDAGNVGDGWAVLAEEDVGEARGV